MSAADGHLPATAGSRIAADFPAAAGLPAGVRSPMFDIVELAALRGREHELGAEAARRHITLPPMGRVAVAGEQIALCVKPDRYFVLSPSVAHTAAAAHSRSPAAAQWQQTYAGIAVAVDLSSALTAFRLESDGACSAFARGCRLDLDPRVFPEGHAAATIVAQVSLILARLENGFLLLTPSTTARHFREWLGEHVR